MDLVSGILTHYNIVPNPITITLSLQNELEVVSPKRKEVERTLKKMNRGVPGTDGLTLEIIEVYLANKPLFL